MDNPRQVVTGTLAAMGVVASLAACTLVSSAASGRSTEGSTLGSATPTASPTPVPNQSASPVLPQTVVVLDPGHNGGNGSAPAEINRQVPAGGFTKPCNTTGTTTDAGYPEHAFTLDVAVRTADLLRAEGVTVLLTRTDDVGVGHCVDVRAAHRQRRRGRSSRLDPCGRSRRRCPGLPRDRTRPGSRQR